MRQNKFGELIMDQSDLCDLIMQGRSVVDLDHVVIDPTLDLTALRSAVENPKTLNTWTFPENEDISISEFDHSRQQKWFMPDSYQQLDIAEHLLSMCKTQTQLQRVGQELLLYQQRNLFDLLRYLKYLVDVMREHRVIWGVGRGSSVASYVLFLLGVHRIDSIYYDLDINEFLR